MKKTKQDLLALEYKLTDKDLKKSTFNHSYWEKNAQKFQTSHAVSWGDINIINLEINKIASYLKNGDFVLDAGCSNGFSTFEIAKLKDITVRAFDFSAGEYHAGQHYPAWKRLAAGAAAVSASAQGLRRDKSDSPFVRHSAFKEPR